MDQPSTSKPATLRSIAERAAVSVCTVSLALRNHPSISAATTRRVQRIARELGYRPNAMVSTLMARIHTRRTDSESPVLGFVSDEGNQGIYEEVPFYRDLLAGVRERAFHLGYRAENFPLKRGVAPARVLCRTLHARNIRGVIIAPLSEGSECRLSFAGLASCALGYTLHTPDLHRVVPNYAQGMRLAWARLLERGYRRPGFVHTEVHLSRTHYERFAAFVAQQTMHPEMEALPPLIFPESMVTPDLRVEACMALVMEWFRRHRPDVLIFPPWGLLNRLRESIRIPEEAGVILADVAEGWCQVAEGAREIGAGAVDMVVAQIHRNETGLPANAKLMAVNTRWVEGFSLPVRKHTGEQACRGAVAARGAPPRRG